MPDLLSQAADLPSFRVIKPSDRLSPDDILAHSKLPDGSSMVGPDGLLVPPARSFNMVVNSATRIYSYRFDEAMRDNFVAARAMQRDAFLLGLLEERYLPTINRDYQLEIDDDADPKQLFVRDTLAKVVRSIPDFDQFKRAALEAVWFGRAGTQWGFERVEGVEDGRFWGLKRWDPLHGDSVQWSFDGHPAVLLDSMTAGWYAQNGAHYGPGGGLRQTDRGGTALVLEKDYWRDRFLIHTHIRKKADYFEGELAGSVQGFGIRGQVYWHYVVRTDALTWMLAYMQAVGQMDLLVFNYPAGNAAAEAAQKANAQQVIGKAAIACPRNPNGNWPAVEQISMNAAGLKALHELVADYFDRHIERLIVGQSMSAGADKGTGLGGTGRAEFTRATKDEILVHDTNRLDATMSSDLVGKLKKYNFPWAKFPVRFKSVMPDLKAQEKVENAQKVVAVGGAVKLGEFLEAAGYTKPEEGDEVVASPQPGMPPMVCVVGPDGELVPKMSQAALMVQQAAGGGGQPPADPQSAAPGGPTPPGFPQQPPGGGPPPGPMPPGLGGEPMLPAGPVGGVNAPETISYTGYPGGGNTYVPSFGGSDAPPARRLPQLPMPTRFGRPGTSVGYSRDAFEAAIDANPHEATTHAVYADWLDENGQPEDAAFHRLMGDLVSRVNLNPPIDPKPRRNETSTLRVKMPWVVTHDDLPDDLRPSDESRWRVETHGPGRDSFFHTGGKGYLPIDPTRHAFDYVGGKSAMRWQTYWNLHTALRNAFRENLARRRQAPPTPASRGAAPTAYDVPRKYCSTQVNLTGEAAIRVLWLANQIRDEDLHPTKGRELVPHVTLRYGLHDEDPSPVGRVLAGAGPVKFRLTGLGVFDGPDYDVLVVDVEGNSLRWLNKKLGKLPNTETFRYTPHCTIGYLKKGRAAKYLKVLPRVDLDVEADGVVFTTPDDATSYLPLGGVQPPGMTTDMHPVYNARGGNPVRYGDQESLRRTVHENPFESTNHLVYADWLDENGDPDRAAFHRVLGKWVGGHDWRDLPRMGMTTGFHPGRRTPSVTVDRTGASPYPWSVHGHYAFHTHGRSTLPAEIGVPGHWFDDPDAEMHGEIMPVDGDVPELRGRRDAEAPPHIARWTPTDRNYSMSWRSYPDMEEGLWRAFRSRLDAKRRWDDYERRRDETDEPLTPPAPMYSSRGTVPTAYAGSSYPQTGSQPSWPQALSPSWHAALNAAHGHAPAPAGGPVDGQHHPLPGTPYHADRERLARDPVAAARQLSQNDAGINESWKVHFGDGSAGLHKPAYGEQSGLRHGVPGDYFRREAAASSVAQLMGMADLVPPTTTRDVYGKHGSVMRWVDGAQTAKDYPGVDGGEYGDDDAAARAALFDYVTGHSDRHTGNWLYHPTAGTVHLIDNGLSLPTRHDDRDYGWVANNEFVAHAAANGLPVPAVDPAAWPEIEKALHAHGVEPDAVALTKQRFDHAAAHAGRPFGDLPAFWDPTPGTTLRTARWVV